MSAIKVGAKKAHCTSAQIFLCADSTMRPYTDLLSNSQLKKHMTPTFKLLIAGLFALTMSACGGDSSTPATPPVPTNPGGSAELTALGIKDILPLGTGLPALPNKVATIEYTGWLYDSAAVETADKPAKAGVEFESNVGKSPLIKTLNSNELIDGFLFGIIGTGEISAMKVNGTRIIYIPSNRAYGSVAQGVIPANSALVFKIKLLAIQ
jgi:FKBP-type peptidyl-prolyl cis-trans isomerase FkpA